MSTKKLVSKRTEPTATIFTGFGTGRQRLHIITFKEDECLIGVIDGKVMIKFTYDKYTETYAGRDLKGKKLLARLPKVQIL